MIKKTSPIRQGISARTGREGSGNHEGNFDFAQRAARNQLTDEENRLLASIETRLTDEMLWLIDALGEFGTVSQSIRKEIPDGANFCKFITGFFSLIAFQFAYALQRSIQRSTFKDDGFIYLQNLGLQFNDFVREVDLDGRKFLAVSLFDENGNSIL